MPIITISLFKILSLIDIQFLKFYDLDTCNNKTLEPFVYTKIKMATTVDRNILFYYMQLMPVNNKFV